MPNKDLFGSESRWWAHWKITRPLKESLPWSTAKHKGGESPMKVIGMLCSSFIDRWLQMNPPLSLWANQTLRFTYSTDCAAAEASVIDATLPANSWTLRGRASASAGRHAFTQAIVSVAILKMYSWMRQKNVMCFSISDFLTTFPERFYELS